MGFGSIRIVERAPVSIDFLAMDPLFTEELIALMRELVPAEMHGEVATSIVVKATKEAT